MNWRTREEWQAQAEYDVRTQCYPSERVGNAVADYLTTDRQTEFARELRELRTHITRLIRALDAGEATVEGVSDVGLRAGHVATVSEEVEEARRNRAEHVVREVVAQEVARRQTDEAWERELAWRRSVETMGAVRVGDAA